MSLCAIELYQHLHLSFDCSCATCKESLEFGLLLENKINFPSSAGINTYHD
jgi:hypothetical protein